MLGARDPDLLPTHDVPVTATDRGGLELRGVRARRRLADAEGLKPQLAGGDAGQQRGLLRLGAVPQQRAHRVHLRVAGAGVGAAAVDFLEDDRRFVDAEAGAAVGFGNEGRQVPGVGERLHEGVGICAGGIELAPIAVGKVLAEIADARAQILMTVRHDCGGDHTWVAGPPAPRQAAPLRSHSRCSLHSAAPLPPGQAAFTARSTVERPHADDRRCPRDESS